MGNKLGKKADGGASGATKDEPAGGAPAEKAETPSELPRQEVVDGPKRRGKGRRCSVSAEVDGGAGGADFKPPVYPKSEADVERISAAVRSCFLFSSLDQDQLRTVVDAMREQRAAAGDCIIRQGEPGDFFYIVESGLFEVFKRSPGEDGAAPEEKKVFAYDGKGSFGELALMYNAPRAATVRAATDGLLWAVDRGTFRHIVVTAGELQRKKYEAFLQRVPLLSNLTSPERSMVADCLQPESFPDGGVVVRQGDPGDRFFIIERGVAAAYQSVEGRDVEVGRMAEGQYFGERSLLTNEPRAATVRALGPLKVAAMDRPAFERLLGNCRDMMGRHLATYQSAKDITSVSADARNGADDEELEDEAEEAVADIVAARVDEEGPAPDAQEEQAQAQEQEAEAPAADADANADADASVPEPEFS